MRAVIRFLVLAALAIPVLAGTSREAAAARSIDFLIRKGSHKDSRGLGIAHPGGIDRRLAFQVLFPASAAYRTRSPSHQADANKLMGLSSLRIHHTSLRLGWAYNPATSKITLRFYAYIQGTRVNEVITEVPLNQWVDVELRTRRDGMSARAAGVEVVKNQPVGRHPTWVLQTAYFGGVETAPQDIEIRVRNIRVR
jgi:hypothetical protein